MAIKFGVATNSDLRIREQNYNNKVKMERIGLYRFETTKLCKAAEKACKDTLQCCVVSKSDMPDGWTETVALTDYDKVVSIYERFGGVRVDTNINEGGDNV